MHSGHHIPLSLHASLCEPDQPVHALSLIHSHPCVFHRPRAEGGRWQENGGLRWEGGVIVEIYDRGVYSLPKQCGTGRNSNNDACLHIACVRDMQTQIERRLSVRSDRHWQR